MQRWIARCTSRLATDRRGNIATIFALSLIPVLGLAGAALDFSNAANARTQLQARLDRAVLVGASSTGDRLAAVAATFATDPARETLEVSPSSDGALLARATLQLDTHIIRLIGIHAISVTVEAEAVPGEGKPACLTLVEPTNQALTVNGRVSVVAPECEIHTLSMANMAALFNGDVTFDVARVCIAGRGYIRNGRVSISRVEPNCNTSDSEFVGTLPNVPARHCDHSDLVLNGSGAVVLEPGVYCGRTVINGPWSVNLLPGFYEFRDGALTINGGVDVFGENVTLYFADAAARPRMNGARGLRLTAPTSGTYAGILMFESPGIAQNTRAIFNGGSGHKLEGLVYLPSRDVVFNGAQSIDADTVTMVFNTLTMNGDSNWALQPSEHAPTGGSGMVALRR